MSRSTISTFKLFETFPDVWIECYGGTYPPDSSGSKEYRNVMYAKVRHFKSCSTCGHLLVVFRSAIYGKRFDAALRRALNSDEKIVVLK